MLNFSRLLNLFLIIIFITLFNYNTSAQRKDSGELGISAGGTFYLGDINKIPFAGTRLSAAAFYRHNINPRYSLTGTFTYGTLYADDAKSKNVFQQQRNKSFKRSFYELSAVTEFNFIPFLPCDKKYYYTPYVFAGLAVAYYPDGSSMFITSIPFGIGFKNTINKNWVFGFYAGMRKTFTDKLDFTYIPPTENAPKKQKGYAGNDDWYSVFGISLSYKINYRLKCPAFD